MIKSRSLILAAMLAAGVLAGCQGANKPEQNSTSNTTQQTQSRLTLGTQSASSKKVVLTNKTGYPIVKAVLQPSGSTQTEVNLLANNQMWPQSKPADLYIAPEDQKIDNLTLTITVKNGNEEKMYQLDGFPAATIGAAADLELDGDALVIKTKDDQVKPDQAQDSKTDSSAAAAPEEQPSVDDTEIAENEEPSVEDSTAPVDPSQDPSIQEPVYIEPVYIGPDGAEEDPSAGPEDQIGEGQTDPSTDAGAGEQGIPQETPADPGL
ncbi:hypothetical protein IM774_01440 [Erysipelotrichaceae bacterium RD49]|nr:hypothetical protein [Erysipelotrichaceae bacterium RD49]